MMKKLAVLTAILAVALAVLAGCDNTLGGGGPYQPGEGEDETQEALMMVSELFEEAGTTEAEETVTRFYTNDPEYWTAKGFTAWTVWGTEEPGDEFTGRKVKVNKSQGVASSGYGLVLCQGTRKVNGQEVPTMLTVMINNEGEYTVGKVIGRRSEILVGWTSTPRLNSGLGVTNELEICPGEAGIKLIINGTEEMAIVDTTEPMHQGGKNGYIVVIAPMDKFPSNSVDVKFVEAR
jgi:predicted small secreted protein